ncbi:hypothetical protein [Bacillus velezensis]|nr:hypothetical protein [Bacillus velezensis]
MKKRILFAALSVACLSGLAFAGIMGFSNVHVTEKPVGTYILAEKPVGT